MRRSPSRSFSFGLIFILLIPIALMGGCGGSSSPDPGTGQPPPKDRMEALQRFKDASVKHDQDAPKKEKSGVK